MQNKPVGKNFEKLNIDDGKFRVVDGVLEKCEDTRCKELKIPKGVMEISKFSIAIWEAETMRVPMSVDAIMSNSVLYAPKLSKLYIENPEIYLEVGCLDNLPNLKEIYIEGEKVDTIVTQKDRGRLSVYLEKYVGDDKLYQIDNDIDVVGNRAFYNCENLERVDFSQSVKDISMWAFEGCKALKEVNFTESLKYISGCAFKSCTGIKELTIPRSVDFMGIEVFKGWRRNQTIRMPQQFKRWRILQKWRRGCRAKIIYY